MVLTDGPAAAARLTASDLVAASYLAVLVTVAAFVLWYSAVAALGPGRAGLITGIAPVAAAMTGIALGSRAPDPLMWAGIAVVAGGLAAGLSARPNPTLHTGQATLRPTESESVAACRVAPTS